MDNDNSIKTNEKQLGQPTIEHNGSTYTLCVVNSTDELMAHEAMTWYPSIRVWVDMEARNAGCFWCVCTGSDDEEVFKMYSFTCEPIDGYVFPCGYPNSFCCQPTEEAGCYGDGGCYSTDIRNNLDDDDDEYPFDLGENLHTCGYEPKTAYVTYSRVSKEVQEAIPQFTLTKSMLKELGCDCE